MVLPLRSAFAQSGPDPTPRNGLTAAQLADFRAGLALFKMVWPLGTEGRNEDQCSDCHFRPTIGGVGHPYSAVVLYGFTFKRPSREIGIEQWPLQPDWKMPPTSVLFFGRADGSGTDAPPHWTNGISRRVARPRFGLGSIEQIDDADNANLADPDDADGNGVSGRKLGRYGSQGQWFSLEDVIREVLTTEVGVLPEGIYAENVRRLAEFARGLRDPVQGTSVNQVRGEALFANIGCTDCHTARFTLPSRRTIRPYSDFLVHDMGACLDDGVALGEAETYEWRTPPLWGIHSRGSALLHDGRGAREEQSIPFHCGEAVRSRDAFMTLSVEEQALIRGFLVGMVAAE
jgi:hypothetical protein